MFQNLINCFNFCSINHLFIHLLGISDKFNTLPPPHKRTLVHVCDIFGASRPQLALVPYGDQHSTGGVATSFQTWE